MFGFSIATQIFQGSTQRTWNCVIYFANLLWTKFSHIKRPVMPRSRKRHHSRSRSRSRSHSHDRSHEKHKKIDSHEKDGKRRKIDSFESPHHKRSVSSEDLSNNIEDTAQILQPCDENVTANTETLLEGIATNDKVSDEDNLEKLESKNANQYKVTNVDQEQKSGSNVNEYLDTSLPKDNKLRKLADSMEGTPPLQIHDETVHKKSSNEEHISKVYDGPANEATTADDSKDLSMDISENEDRREERTNEFEKSGSVVEVSDAEVSLEDTASDKKNKSEISTKKSETPKQTKRQTKKLESEKKRVERQKEKEERERKKNEEKERSRLEKLKQKQQKEAERQKLSEQKQKEKELKEEQKRKEKEEKELKRREKEEKEEQKRKERELEKQKKQQEIEERNKEKQKEEEKKQKTAAAFVNFFVAKKCEVTHDEKRTEKLLSNFMPFEVKSDMRLPPIRRTPMTTESKEKLQDFLKNPDKIASYLKDLKSGKSVGKSFKTWPYVDREDDVAIIEDDSNLGETICEDVPKVQKLRSKYLQFHENRRPAYFGTWRKSSKYVKPRRPFSCDNDVFNYEEDSDDDWEEEEQGESLDVSDDEDKENEDEKDDYEVDNEFFVPHGHLSDDEVDDEETTPLSPESLKQKLKLLKDEFEEDMKSKTHKLKSRSIGCIWYNKDARNVDEAIHKYLQPFAMITQGHIIIKKRSEILNYNPSGGKKCKPLQELSAEHIPLFLKVIHGNVNRKKVLVDQFLSYMANNGFSVETSKTSLRRILKELATYKRCREDGPMKNKFGWFVNDDIKEKYNIDIVLPNSTES